MPTSGFCTLATTVPANHRSYLAVAAPTRLAVVRHQSIHKRVPAARASLIWRPLTCNRPEPPVGRPAVASCALGVLCLRWQIPQHQRQHYQRDSRLSKRRQWPGCFCLICLSELSIVRSARSDCSPGIRRHRCPLPEGRYSILRPDQSLMLISSKTYGADHVASSVIAQSY
jgi:hypothetical protein